MPTFSQELEKQATAGAKDTETYASNYSRIDTIVPENRDSFQEKLDGTKKEPEQKLKAAQQKLDRLMRFPWRAITSRENKVQALKEFMLAESYAQAYAQAISKIENPQFMNQNTEFRNQESVAKQYLLTLFTPYERNNTEVFELTNLLLPYSFKDELVSAKQEGTNLVKIFLPEEQIIQKLPEDSPIQVNYQSRTPEDNAHKAIELAMQKVERLTHFPQNITASYDEKLTAIKELIKIQVRQDSYLIAAGIFNPTFFTKISNTQQYLTQLFTPNELLNRELREVQQSLIEIKPFSSNLNAIQQAAQEQARADLLFERQVANNPITRKNSNALTEQGQNRFMTGKDEPALALAKAKQRVEQLTRFPGKFFNSRSTKIKAMQALMEAQVFEYAYSNAFPLARVKGQVTEATLQRNDHKIEIQIQDNTAYFKQLFSTKELVDPAIQELQRILRPEDAEEDATHQLALDILKTEQRVNSITRYFRSASQQKKLTQQLETMNADLEHVILSEKLSPSAYPVSSELSVIPPSLLSPPAPPLPTPAPPPTLESFRWEKPITFDSFKLKTMDFNVLSQTGVSVRTYGEFIEITAELGKEPPYCDDYSDETLLALTSKMKPINASSSQKGTQPHFIRTDQKRLFLQVDSRTHSLELDPEKLKAKDGSPEAHTNAILINDMRSIFEKTHPQPRRSLSLPSQALHKERNRPVLLSSARRHSEPPFSDDKIPAPPVSPKRN